MRYMQIR